MHTKQAKHNVGRIVHHKLFDYRGVIVDVDPCFQNSDQWYNLMARSKPAKEQPWYHVLVDNTDFITYVAEQNLDADQDQLSPIHHPDVKNYFEPKHTGAYIPKRRFN